jgi:hypothetical protein
MNWVGELAEGLNRRASPQRLVGEDYVGFEDSLPTPRPQTQESHLMPLRAPMPRLRTEDS